PGSPAVASVDGESPDVGAGPIEPTPLVTDSSMMRMLAVKPPPAPAWDPNRFTWNTTWSVGTAPLARFGGAAVVAGDPTAGPISAGTFRIGAAIGWAAATERSCRDSSDSAQGDRRRRARSDQ